MDWKIDGDRPIWLQLKEQLAKQIVSGEYHPGDKLPSVRELARDAGVNPNTMQRSLAALDQEGLTITSRTSGRTITENADKLDACRQEIAEKIIAKYLFDMTELGYTKEDAINLLKKGE
jgi:GntR family transcriptional regulator